MPAIAVAKHAPVAQLDRASDYESEGRTFESFRARHFSSFSHLVISRRFRLNHFTPDDIGSLASLPSGVAGAQWARGNDRF